MDSSELRDDLVTRDPAQDLSNALNDPFIHAKTGTGFGGLEPPNDALILGETLGHFSLRPQMMGQSDQWDGFI